MSARKESYLPGFDLRAVCSSRESRGRHGGEHALGKRKTARPIDPKQALHVVMRSSQAQGERSMLHPNHCGTIHRFTEKLATMWGVRLYRYANVGNHIHLLIKVPSRAVWQRFSRELAGGIAVIVTGARKGDAIARPRSGDRPESALRGFWDGLVFTRIVSFGRDYENMKRYLVKNLFEAAGINMKKLLAQGLRIVTIGADGKLSSAPT